MIGPGVGVRVYLAAGKTDSERCFSATLPQPGA